MKDTPTIVVVGSLNVDHTFRVPMFPKPGETLVSSGSETCFGGKGGNQAVAASRAGAKVRLIGCVGDDEPGHRYLDHLAEEGIDFTGVLVSEDKPTGSAFITVDDSGENCIVVNPGANHALTQEKIGELSGLMLGADALLIQLECPLDVVIRAAEIAKKAGVAVILNPSPWMEDLKGLGDIADVMIVNETEAQALTGRSAESVGFVDIPNDGVTLIITRGARQILGFGNKGGRIEIQPPEVIPLDTVGAGDAFAGAFAVAHASGHSLTDAIWFASASGALATLMPGAQSAIPSKPAILEFLKQHHAITGL
ncbi:ribokinase [Verrucomicrobia bacterium]|nr:ribokinase [Verrucomicrobiota bacterium]